jgi:hypothetical protein
MSIWVWLLIAVGGMVVLLQGLNFFRRPRQASCLHVRPYVRPLATLTVTNPETAAKPKRSAVFYRTNDGLADYCFSFEKQADGGLRIYIVSQPDYGSQDTGSHTTHRLTDGSRHYVCWDGWLGTEEDARKVAALWADSTQKYIRTGRRF